MKKSSLESEHRSAGLVADVGDGPDRTRPIKAAESLESKPRSAHPSSCRLRPEKSGDYNLESESFGGVMIGTLPSRGLSLILTAPYE